MFSKILSGTLLIAGTTIGAGMLGIPLVTAQAGFFSAVMMTICVWLFMLATGFLYLEAAMAMPAGSNILSMSFRFLGKGGKSATAAVYLFLYYCLMVAYFAAGAPVFLSFFGGEPGVIGYFLFGALFALIIIFGLRAVDRINYILMAAMFLAYVILVGAGLSEVRLDRLLTTQSSSIWMAAPILFSAFGFHNVIPSLADYFQKDTKILKRAIFFGTLIPLCIYLVWQWLIIGVVPIEAIETAFQEGKPATALLSTRVGSSSLMTAGAFFGFFAIITSMLGVAFSMVDFIADGVKVEPKKKGIRTVLSAAVFVPAFLLSSIDPNIFIKAIGFAGGFGEAFLNGLLPVLMIWIMRYRKNIEQPPLLFGGRWMLGTLFSLSLFVVLLECKSLFCS